MMMAAICFPSYRPQTSHMTRTLARIEARYGWPWVPNGEGHAHPGKARNVLASALLTDPKFFDVEWSFWADDDMAISEEGILHGLREAEAEDRDVLQVLYVPHAVGAQRFVADLDHDDLDELSSGSRGYRFGDNGRHYRAARIGFGAVFVRRRVWEALAYGGVAKRCAVGTSQGRGVMGWEFFPSGAHLGHEVLSSDGAMVPAWCGEDYGFCELCRRAGVRFHVTTRFRTFHLGDYWFTWEDAFRRPALFKDLEIAVEGT